MEGSTVIFAVDSGQCSDDEDDDLQRKEELHQLLSEQLADDLLDDTLSMEGEISLLSTPQDSGSPNLSQIDTTPDESPSHDNHMTTAPDQFTPDPLQPSSPVHSSGLRSPQSPPPVVGVAYLHDEPDLLSRSPYKLRPPLPLSSDISDVFAGTSQSYANHSISLPTIMRESDNQLFHHGSSQDGLPLSHNIQTGSHDLTSLSHDLHYTHYSESDISSYSDNFPTVFSTHDPTEHAQTSSITNGYPTPISQAKVTTGYTTEHAHYAHSHHDPPPHDTSSQVTLLTPHTHATGRLEQLEILYDARGRQINQLTSQLTANADDSERHIRILRHEKLLIENERNEFAIRLEQLENSYRAMEETIATTQGELAAEKIKSCALESNKAELISRLQAAESTVNSLTKQVTDLTSSDTLSRIRDNYSQAMSAAAYEHKQELLSVQEEVDHHRHQLEEKNTVISQLEQQVRELGDHGDQIPHSHKPRQEEATYSLVQQQLQYGYEGCEGVRVVELVGRVEDLTFQLSTTQEELEQAIQRAAQAESELRCGGARLGELELLNSELSEQLATLQSQLDTVTTQAEADKRAALEHCRAACLQLHEDSTQRLKETMENERQKLTQDTDRSLARLKTELAAVQEQYVALAMDKDRLEGERTESNTKLQSKVVETVSPPSSIPRQSGEDTGPPSSLDSAVREAVRSARIEWLKEKETSLTGHIESAVCAAQKLWREQHLMELDTLKKQHEAVLEAHRTSAEGKETEPLQTTIQKTKLECDQKYRAQLTVTLATERKQWEAESRGKWAGQERTILATAHQEWRTAQESAIAREVERSRMEWEESHKHKTQVAVHDAVLKAKRHYEGVVKKMHSELVVKYETQKSTMTNEVRQLETRLASLLQRQHAQDHRSQVQQNVTKDGASSKTGAGGSDCQSGEDEQTFSDVRTMNGGEEGSDGQGVVLHRLVGGVSDESVDTLRGLLKNTAGDLKKDILLLLAGELESVRKLHRDEIARTRESTAQQVKQYYLQCLHQLVNSKSRDKESRSHDPPTNPPKTAVSSHRTHLQSYRQKSHDTRAKSHGVASLDHPSTSHTTKPSKSTKHATTNSPHRASIVKTASTQPGNKPVINQSTTCCTKLSSSGASLKKGTISGTLKTHTTRGTRTSDVVRQGSKRNLFGTN